MKNSLLAIMTFAVFLYGFGSFIAWSFDPANWNESGRIAVVVLWSVVSGGFFLLTENKRP